MSNRKKIEIFWGITTSRSYIKTIPSSEAVMMSALGLWNGHGWRKKRKWIWDRWMLDSGGFMVAMKYGQYPWSPDDYLELVETMKPTLAVSMDYPCEADITPFLLMNTKARIEATAIYANYLCKKSDRIFPVLQGQTIEEYEYSWKLTKSINPKIVGIGSICKRQSSHQINILCRDLFFLLPRHIWIHGFGVKIKALRYSWPRILFNSIDTNAWEFHLRGRKRNKENRIKEPKAWMEYASKCDELKRLPEQEILALD